MSPQLVHGGEPVFFWGDIYPQTLKSLGIRQNICGYVSTNFGKLWIENVEICLSERLFLVCRATKALKNPPAAGQDHKTKILGCLQCVF